MHESKALHLRHLASKALFLPSCEWRPALVSAAFHGSWPDAMTFGEPQKYMKISLIAALGSVTYPSVVTTAVLAETDNT